MSFIVSAISLCLAAASVATPGDHNCVTNILDIPGLAKTDYAAGRPFSLSGVVLISTPWWIDITNGEHHEGFECADGMTKDAHVGDVVHVEGNLYDGGVGRETRICRRIEVVERRQAPKAVPIEAKKLSDAESLYRRVKVTGALTSVNRDEFDKRFNWLVFTTRDETFCAAVFDQQHDVSKLRGMVNSVVEAEGTVLPFLFFRKASGSFVMIAGDDDIRVVRTGTVDHLDAPTVPRALDIMRQHMRGTVLAACGNRFFIRTTEHPCLPVYPTDIPFTVKTGDKVSVSGYATSGPFGLQLFGALVKATPRPPVGILPAEIDLAKSPPDLRNPYKAARELYGRVVRVTGVTQLADQGESDAIPVIVSQERHYRIDVSGLPKTDQKLISMSAVMEVTGICLPEYELHPAATGLYHFRGFTIVPRLDSDIRTIKSPPWWTAGRMFVVILVLGVVVIIVLAWNRMLRKLSERRGQQLYREQIEHERASLKIEERTRLAIELHDSISQTLTGVAMHVESASRANGGANAAVDKFLQTGIWMLSSCRRELKSCLWDLHRRTFEEKDMTEAIIRTIEPHKGNAAVTVRFNVARSLFTEPVTHAILRIIRELVSNAVRHGHATHVQVAGELRDGVVRFSVRDNGCGFDVSRTPGPSQGHFGLSGIRERLRQYGGNIKMESAVGKGTKTTVTMNAIEAKGHEE
ncbi:MAG: sensor histidine kinase [Kiritimatiellae bacterium]|nr:sensor histidine kinase [Kiritimatiellia bacterium]